MIDQMTAADAYYEILKIKQQKYDLEDIISKSAQYSFNYASEICSRFHKGEAAIAMDPDYSLEYARHIICGRFPLGEAAMAKK